MLATGILLNSRLKAPSAQGAAFMPWWCDDVGAVLTGYISYQPTSRSIETVPDLSRDGSSGSPWGSVSGFPAPAASSDGGEGGSLMPAPWPCCPAACFFFFVFLLLFLLLPDFPPWPDVDPACHQARGTMKTTMTKTPAGRAVLSRLCLPPKAEHNHPQRLARCPLPSCPIAVVSMPQTHLLWQLCCHPLPPHLWLWAQRCGKFHVQLLPILTVPNRFRRLSSKKRAPGGCSFLRVRLAFPWSAPRGTHSSTVTDLAGPQWQLGGRRVRLWRSAETGEGAPSVRRNIYLLPFSCRISRVLENWRSEFPNFLHAAPYWNSKDTLLPRFAKILLCVDL